MLNYTIIEMTDHSNEQIDAIARLEQRCKQFEQINVSVGIEHLGKEGGDRAILCYRQDDVIGVLAWYTSDGIIANVNGIVHPDYRRQGVFRSMLQRARENMKLQGLQTICYRIPSGSDSGFGCVQSLGAGFNRSEYSMTLAHLRTAQPHHSDVGLRPAQPADLEFIVSCLSQAFGDSESWTREYWARTNKPGRMNFIALANHTRVGLIRVNALQRTTAIIHDFCILPSRQGKGLGRDVLAQTVSLLLEEGFAQIRLSVVTVNDRALHLYRNVGFEVRSEFQYYIGDL